MQKIDLSKIPYAEWLESVLKDLFDIDVRSICVSGVANDGNVFCSFYDTTIGDKLAISGVISQHAMLDTLEANGMIT